MDLEILHEDPDLIAVNKPSGLPVVPNRGASNDLVSALTAQLARAAPVVSDSASPTGRLLVVHRLDQDTSGVVVLARHVAAQRDLASQFGRRVVSKIYWALVEGHPQPSQGRIDIALEADPQRYGAMKLCQSRHGGKLAVTDYTVLETLGRLALVEVRPQTGRTHQIRVHLKAIGHPLAVDPLYGSNLGVRLSDFKVGYRLAQGHTERPLLARLSLHARALTVFKPGQPDETQTFQAELPKDFRGTLDALRRWTVRPHAERAHSSDRRWRSSSQQ